MDEKLWLTEINIIALNNTAISVYISVYVILSNIFKFHQEYGVLNPLTLF